MTAITPAMSEAIGTEINRRTSYPVSASDIRRWAIAAYWPEPAPLRYLDRDEQAIIAPEDLNPFAWASAAECHNPAATAVSGHDPDATEKRIGIDGPGLRRQLNGGLRIEYGAPIRVGDVIESVRVLSGYEEREGRLGQMLFTTTAETWTNQRGEFVKRAEMTLIRY